MPRFLFPLLVLVTVILAGCATSNREARCQARGHAAASAGLQSCIDSLAREDRKRRNRHQTFGQASGG